MILDMTGPFAQDLIHDYGCKQYEEHEYAEY